MKNADQPAYPIQVKDPNGDPCQPTLGLTKREYFAGLAVQGMLADPNRNLFPQQYAEMAIEVADALIVELEKSIEK